jgi:hypothetical protein
MWCSRSRRIDVGLRLEVLPGDVEIAAEVRFRPPLFTVAYSPKAPQKWLERTTFRLKCLK